MTREEMEEFLKPFDFLTTSLKNLIPSLWFTRVNKGATLFDALKATVRLYVTTKTLKESDVNIIMEALDVKLVFNVDSKESEPKEVEPKEVEPKKVAQVKPETVKSETKQVDYVHMSKDEWRNLRTEQKKVAKPIEQPDPDYSKFLEAIPAEKRCIYHQQKLITYDISEQEVTEHNKEFFDMFVWPMSPVHSNELKAANNKAYDMMTNSEDPEELCKERIDYMASHRFILTVPRINSFAENTRVVSTDNINLEVIQQMREWKDQKGNIVNEAINEVLTPQMIAVHPYIDFDFNFDKPDEQTDEQKLAIVDGVFNWLEQLKKNVFGKYCVGGYTKVKCLADKYFDKDYELYKGAGKQLSLHVIFYEKAMLVSDLIKLFEVKNSEFIYTKNMCFSVDPKVYEIGQRRVFRHTLSPKLGREEGKEYKELNLMYNGKFLNDYQPPLFEDSFVTLTGRETPVKQEALKEFFDYDHLNPKGEVPKAKVPKDKSPKPSNGSEKVDTPRSNKVEFQDDNYKEYKIKVTLPKEYMRNLLDMVPWKHYGESGLYQPENLLHQSISAFIANSPYSEKDTLELLDSWWLKDSHRTHDGEMSKMVDKEYFKDGIHDQHNNTYFHCFFKYVTSLVPRVEEIEAKYCENYNINIGIYKLFKDDLNKKYVAATKNRNFNRDYKPYINRLEAAASQIVDLPIAPSQSQDDYSDLTGSDSENSQYDWLPEIMKIVYPGTAGEDAKKPKINDSTKFKFHVTMFKLQQMMKEEIEAAKSKREPLEKIKCEFDKRVMSINDIDTDECYKCSIYNNFYDESSKDLVTLTYNRRKEPIRSTTEKKLREFYKYETIDVTRFWHTSLEELEKLSKEQRLLPVYAVSNLDSRTKDAKKFIEIVKKTFRRPIDAKAYFEFLRKKLEKPEEKLDRSICCYGASGVFKSAMTDIVSSFITTKILSMKDVENQFNYWIIGTSLAVVEEIAQQEERAGDKAEALKRIHNHHVNVQAKHGDLFDTVSHMNMILNCNFASIGGLMDFRETNDMSRRFILMPRIKPDNLGDDIDWGGKYIRDGTAWKFIAAMILREEYLTDEEREELLKYQKEEETPRFKTKAGNRGILNYVTLQGFLRYTGKTSAESKGKRTNMYCLYVDSLSQELKKNNPSNAGNQSEKAFLQNIGVLDLKNQRYNYVIDIAKYYLTYVSCSIPEATQILLKQLAVDYPWCVESETYKNELKSWLEETGAESLNDEIEENPETPDFPSYD